MNYRNALFVPIIGALLVAFALPAQALLTIDDPDNDDRRIEHSELNTSGNLFADDIETIVGTGTDLSSLYKADFGTTTDEDGTFAAYYSTVWTGLEGDPPEPTGATISHDGGPSIVCPECYLLVKDGANGDPPQYLFDLNEPTAWDGIMDIVLKNFWSGDGVQGSISHVEIFGGGGSTRVPAPGTLALLGFGLILLASSVRRRMNPM